MYKLKLKSGLIDNEDEIDQSNIEVCFEELLFLRIAFEFSKMYIKDRSQDYIDYLDKLVPNFDEYHTIFTYLLNNCPYVPVPSSHQG